MQLQEEAAEEEEAPDEEATAQGEGSALQEEEEEESEDEFEADEITGRCDIDDEKEECECIIGAVGIARNAPIGTATSEFSIR